MDRNRSKQAHEHAFKVSKEESSPQQRKEVFLETARCTSSHVCCDRCVKGREGGGVWVCHVTTVCHFKHFFQLIQNSEQSD